MNDISSILHILDEEENFVFFHEKSFISHFFGEEYLDNRVDILSIHFSAYSVRLTCIIDQELTEEGMAIEQCLEWKTSITSKYKEDDKYAIEA